MNLRSTVVAGALVLAGCSSSKVLIPPRVDLARYGTIGMIEFSSPTPDLSHQVSKEFLGAVQSAQPGTAVLELGDQNKLLTEFRAQAIDAETIRTIGARYHVDAIMVGVLGAQETKPHLKVESPLQSPSIDASATLQGALDARLFDAHSGATVWSTSAQAEEPLARVSVSGGGLAGIGAKDPDEAKARLVRGLVERATMDFWSHWERQ
jgi:hypothetical protein